LKSAAYSTIPIWLAYAFHVSVQKETKSRKIEDSSDFDVAIIGAGINGAVAAAALSASGLKVLLVDKGDFAGFTSQESSNLVWGGIKYLQSYEFWLVFKLSLARNRLMRSYPNQIKEIGFLASIGPTAPFGRVLGTFGTLFYWGIGLFGTQPPRSYSAKRAKELEPNLVKGRKAVMYFDAKLPDNDSRFVYDFIRNAKAKGASARNYTELNGAEFTGGHWKLSLASGKKLEDVTAKAVVNAAGPFSGKVSELLGSKTKASLVFSKGIHLILNRRIAKENQVLAFWDEQERLFYVLPMGDRSMVGTTDTRVDSPETQVTQEDRDFVIRQINAQLELEIPISYDQVVAERCGVRPLVVESKSDEAVTDWHQLSRKHILEIDRNKNVVTILGGKLTDCLNIGQETISEIRKLGLQANDPGRWFGEGDQIRKKEFFALISAQLDDPAAATRIAEGLWRRQGVQAFEIIAGKLATEIIPGIGVTEAEIRHIANHEDVQVREDLLRRRLPISMTRSPQELSANKELEKLLVELGL
jgi:glycerol-3-phosphate dehydrogenase